MKKIIFIYIFFLATSLFAQDDLIKDLKDLKLNLSARQQTLAEPKANDWLSHNDEPGQSFEEFIKNDYIEPVSGRDTIYIQPIGRFNPEQRRIVGLSAEFLELFYGYTVKIKSDIPLFKIPMEARRKNPIQGMDQILAPYIIEEILPSKVNEQTFMCIGLTAQDLWPGEGWNYVFGQASLDERVGVWSIYRYGNPSLSEQAYQTCLLLTLKISVHEMGHMFGIRHCIVHNCIMNGTNHIGELDQKPLYLCSECLPKLIFSIGANPYERAKKIIKFLEDNNLLDQAQEYNQLYT